MTTEQIESLCKAASKRLAKFINQAGAQHLRRMRESWKQLGKL